MWQKIIKHCKKLRNDWHKYMDSRNVQNIPPLLVSFGESDSEWVSELDTDSETDPLYSRAIKRCKLLDNMLPERNESCLVINDETYVKAD
ncbi:hypothetical protein ILUMI_15403 [Ignelater luminosus]|uniref:Uncharacterized protein n=1 Tax=Ignelater luminosus TaxID=2038154 RepID=A0A8K0CWL5_IGNLU|nr:hypothetical protein ILUMI_15403 [Ignelater luminosus]